MGVFFISSVEEWRVFEAVECVLHAFFSFFFFLFSYHFLVHRRATVESFLEDFIVCTEFDKGS